MAVVPAPPWCTTAATRGKSGRARRQRPCRPPLSDTTQRQSQPERGTTTPRPPAAYRSTRAAQGHTIAIATPPWTLLLGATSTSGGSFAFQDPAILAKVGSASHLNRVRPQRAVP